MNVLIYVYPLENPHYIEENRIKTKKYSLSIKQQMR
jgi:hypothetical protein